MPRHKVFICYSHKDKELFDQFLKHLDPYSHQHLLEISTDREILPGAQWQPEIYRRIAGADAAVVLVSPDLLASEFVREQELPRLLQAREEGRLTLAPLFLRHAATKFLRFEVDTADGVREIDLTELQGLNQSSEPLAVLPAAEQDKVLAAAAEKLYDVLRGLPGSHIRPGRRELTAVLELRQARLARRYGQPPHFDLLANSTGVDLPRLETLLAARGEAAREELGRELFELLLGSEQDRTAILSSTLGRKVHDPLRHAFRIRIRADEQRLRELPWPLCRWRQHLLAEEGWTFEIAASRDPKPVERLQTPCQAVLVAAEPSNHPPLKAQAHQSSLENIFAQAWKQPRRKSCFQRVRTSPELKQHRAEPPRLLHVYAHARGAKRGLELLLEGASGRGVGLSFAALAKMLAERPPQVVVLSTVGDCPLAPPLPGVSVLLHLRHGDADFDSRRVTQEWWRKVVGTGTDPVTAFYELPEAWRRRGAIITDYQRWEASHSDYVPKEDRPRSRLDRTRQRQVVWGAVRELVDNPRRRVTCLLAYGAEGNLVDHFSAQMVDTLHDWARDSARLQRYKLSLPARREALSVAGIEEHFRDLMQLQPDEPLRAPFRRHRRGGPRAKPVYLLDWDTYGPGHERPLRSGQLESWLTFCCQNLEPACPESARILSYLAVISPVERHREMKQLFDQLKTTYLEPHFDFVPIPALGEVTATDLLRFMENEDNCSCPRAYLRTLPERIVRHTGGDFEATVKLLEDAERGNLWYELDQSLPAAPRRTTPRKDIEF